MLSSLRRIGVVSLNNAKNRRSFFTIVHVSTESWRLFLGKNPQLLHPGIHLNLPFFHTIRVVDMKEGMIGVNDLHCYTKDNVPVTMDFSLFYQVHDSKMAIFNVQNFKSAIGNLGTSAARSVIGQFEYDEVNADRNRLNKTLCETIGKASEKWGTSCTKFEIQTVAPRNKQAEQILEIQMTAERRRRETQLDTNGRILSAQGDKESAVLKSEGELISMKNKAESDKISISKHAEANRYNLDQETEAMIERLKKTTEVLGNPELASQFWIEQKRIESMAKIASGTNNNNYIIPTNIFEMIKNYTSSTKN